MKIIILSLISLALYAEDIQTNGFNFVARSWGGHEWVVLPGGQKLEGITWKNNSMWILMRKARPGEYVGDEYQFQEKSNWGLIEGTVYIKEAVPEQSAKKTKP